MLLHDHLDGGLRASTAVTSPVRSDTTGCRPRMWPRSRPGCAGERPRPPEVLPGRVPAHGRGHADPRGPDPVAAECAEDLAADGVVYAEVRFPPSFTWPGESTWSRWSSAVWDSSAGPAVPGAGHHGVRAAHRDARICWCVRLGIAEVAGAAPGRGRWSASTSPGAERAASRTRHLDAFQYVARENLPHHYPRRAGVWAAVDLGGAAVVWSGVARPTRRGSWTTSGSARTGTPRWVGWPAMSGTAVDPLGDGPSSTRCTGVARSIEAHPIGLLRQLSFRVTVKHSTTG